MISRFLLVAAAWVVVGATSCKKEQTKVTLKEKLTAKAWKSTSFSANGAPATSWCWLNSVYEFTQAGTAYYTQGDNLGACSGNPTGTISSYPYVVTANEKYIILVTSFPTSADTFEVISISSELLKTKRIVNKNTPSPDTWEDTFTAQ
ncbi:MAG: hypothetical protein KIS94_06595 [Chitinophagales bacterium]|nr:hypothetical protein [Chitinophagales bacterium]